MQNAASDHDLLNGRITNTSAANGSTTIETQIPHHSATTSIEASVHDTNEIVETGTVEPHVQHEEVAVVATHAAKKRKFDEFNTRSGSSSRAVSPPWKTFAADGPTQFTENGKRRSGRVNHVPLEMQPPSNKRQTRAAHGQSVQLKDIKRRAGDSEHVGHRKVGTTTTTSKGDGRSYSNSDNRVYEGAPSASQPKSPGLIVGDNIVVKQSFGLQACSEYPSVNVDNKHLLVSPEKRRPGRPPKASRVVEAASPDVIPLPHQKSGHELARSSQPSPKLRLKLPRLHHPPRHPGHIPKPSEFATLTDVLRRYDAVDNEQGNTDQDADPSHDLDRRAVEKSRPDPEACAIAEARIRTRILQASHAGGSLSRERSGLYLPDTQEQPASMYGHFDYLWAHGAYLRTLITRERSRHMETAKKAAYACLAVWKARQPQTEEEKRKEEDEYFRLTYRQTVRDVRSKWEMVTNEVERRRLARWTEEQELTRDRKMQRMLDDTTRMLDRRRTGIEEIDSPTTEGYDDYDDDDDDDDVEVRDDDNKAASPDDHDNAGSDDDLTMADVNDTEANMSTSASEDSEAAVSADEDGDDKLSPEALRSKYATLNDAIPDAREHETVVERPRRVSQHLAAQVRGRRRSGHALEIETEEESTISDGEMTESANKDINVENVALEEVDVALLDDEDEESTDMSDDMSSSDGDSEGADSDVDVDVSNRSDAEEDSGLLGFFSGHDRLRARNLDALSPKTEDPRISATMSRGPTDVETFLAEAEGQSSGTDYLGSREEPAADAQEGDHSSQPTPMDYSTGAPTEAESTTTIDLEDAKVQIVPSVEETQAYRTITTKIPTLLRGTLRAYQHHGLDWLAKLYASQTNGILADEMGLGKTIQTISLLAHLAEEHGVWGPHLIVVPTSVILNWEMEFKKFLPGFNVLSYYGTAEERKEKRKGWSNPDIVNVVITSYQLVLKDLNSVRVPEWHYMILDEAHNIKNFQSQRYQAMIRLKTHARLLLTGTPLQNSIQELWSLLTFLTAGQSNQGMGDLDEFTQWFKRPVEEIFVDGRNRLGVEAQEIVNKLHHSLRPYILRRMKSQVEQQLPAKYEHTVFCRLSKRQRQLYDAFLSRTDVKEKLSSGNPISVSQALMALRKVCNHPDLFEERPIVTSFTMRRPRSTMPKSVVADFEIQEMLLRRRLVMAESDNASWLIERDFDIRGLERTSRYQARRSRQLMGSHILRRHLQHQVGRLPLEGRISGSSVHDTLVFGNKSAETARLDKMQCYINLTDERATRGPMYGCDLRERCTILTEDRIALPAPRRPAVAREYPFRFDDTEILPNMVKSVHQRSEDLIDAIRHFAFVTPNVVAHDLLALTLPSSISKRMQTGRTPPEPDAFHEARMRLSIAFPDKRLLQYDCGKLQQLAKLLRELQSRGSRALIFTQMTSVLDILEQFLNIYGYRYMRLDGSTRIEQRQDMMERFNRDTRIDVFILSSRSGGIGLNLTGADSVIFYDLDWNPQMDKQCQDRAHRIGQTRNVHIYKLVSEHTIEVNILRKSNQKRMLDEVVIQEGDFTTDVFNRVQEEEQEGYAADDEAGAAVDRVLGLGRKEDLSRALAEAEDEVDVQAAQAQQKEALMDDADFDFDSKQRSRSGTAGAGTPVTIDNPHDIVEATDTRATEMVGKEEIPHVDEYMLSLMEEMLKGTPFVPPVDKSKRGRLDKNGRDRSHRPKKQ